LLSRSITPLELEQLKEERQTLLAGMSLYEFYKQAWSIIEGRNPFFDNWHIQAIAEHLEACYRREIKNLIVNVPPRSGKTSLISIAFPAWVWINKPEEKFLYTSYAHSLSKEHSLKCKNLIESNWYQERWGHLFKIQKNTEAYFDNDKKGHRNSTSVEGTGTGKGGNIIVLDDINNVKDSMSKLILEKTNRYLDQVLSSRFDHPEEGVTIEVQQRTGMLDATGHLISNDTEKEQVMLVIPARYEHSAKCKTVILPMSKGKVWEDPRTEEGEVLCPKRLPKKVLDRLEKKLGAYSFASQYQQRAAPLEGNIIKKAWFQWWKDSSPPEIEHVLQSWDTAISDKDTADFSACTTWGVFYDHNYISNVILLSMWKGRLAYPELRAMAQRLYFDYRDTGIIRNPEFKGRRIDVCLIEQKATGDPLIRDLRNAGITAIPFNPTKQGDKEGRVQRISHLIEGGLVWLPAQSPNYTKLLPYADKFLEEVAVFPRGESRDVIDSMSQALRKLYDTNLIRYPKDERPNPPSDKHIRVY
jgi:predicted phage terminase large subunit-like protein